MILGGGAFCIGAILCAFAQDLAMLIIGRVCLGAGVGFANQVSLPHFLHVTHMFVLMFRSCAQFSMLYTLRRHILGVIMTASSDICLLP